MTEFNVKVRALAGFEKTAVVTPIGPLQESTCPILSRELHHVAEQGYRTIILDFSRVEVLNGRAVVSLKGMSARLRNLGSQLSLVRVAPPQQRVLAELSNPTQLPIYPDIKDVVSGSKPMLGGRGFQVDTRLSEEFLEDSQEFGSDSDWQFAQSDDDMFDPDSEDGFSPAGTAAPEPKPQAPYPAPDDDFRSMRSSARRSSGKRRTTPRFDADAQTPDLGITPPTRQPKGLGQPFPRPQSELEPPAPRPMDLESWSMPELIDPFASLETPPAPPAQRPPAQPTQDFASGRALDDFDDDRFLLSASQESVPPDDKEPCEPPPPRGGPRVDPFSVTMSADDPFAGPPQEPPPTVSPHSLNFSDLDPFSSGSDEDFGKFPGGFPSPPPSPSGGAAGGAPGNAAFGAFNSRPASPPPSDPLLDDESLFPTSSAQFSRGAPEDSPFSASPDLTDSRRQSFPSPPAKAPPPEDPFAGGDDPFAASADPFEAGAPRFDSAPKDRTRSATPPSMDLFGAGDPFAGLEEPIKGEASKRKKQDRTGAPRPKPTYRKESAEDAPRRRTARKSPPKASPPPSQTRSPSIRPAARAPEPQKPAAGKSADFAPPPAASSFAPPPRLTDPPTTFAPLPELPELKPDPPLFEAGLSAAPAPTMVAAPRAEPEPTLSAEQTQKVHFSVFAPPCLRPGAAFLLKVWAFLDAQREEVMRRARAARSLRQAGSKGPVPLPKGAQVTLILELPGFRVPDPVETLLWDEEIADGSFEVAVPPNMPPGPRLGKISVLVAGLQVARVSFELQVAAGPVPDDLPSMPAPSSQHRVRSVFCSYASANRIEVLQWKRGAEVAGVEAFVDVLSLREGQNWEQELWRHVPSKDLFCLFWSEAASRSPWVEKEWRCALQSRGADYIHPVSLVDPRIVPPPRELSSSKHFNDLTRIVMDYERHWRR